MISRNRFFQPLNNLYRQAQFSGQDLINQYEGKTQPLNPAPYKQPTATDTSVIPYVINAQDISIAADNAVAQM